MLHNGIVGDLSFLKKQNKWVCKALIRKKKEKAGEIEPPVFLSRLFPIPFIHQFAIELYRFI